MFRIVVNPGMPEDGFMLVDGSVTLADDPEQVVKDRRVALVVNAGRRGNETLAAAHRVFHSEPAP